MKDNNDELVKKFLYLQQKFMDSGGDGASEGREWNEFVKQYQPDSILRISAFQIPRISCFFSSGGWKFPFKVKLSGKFEYVNFDNSQFEKEFDSSWAEFSECTFRSTIFYERGNFNFSKFSKKACFDGAVFKKDAHFFYAKVSGEMTFCGAKFDGEAVFAEIEFGKDLENILLMDGAKFGETVYLINFSYQSKKYEGSLKSFSLDRVNFNAPTTIDLKLEKCPDFSKCHFLKKVVIEESWQIDEQKIDSEDEPKFRFLKKYFAEQGNHFKEQEYFSHEMSARKELLSRRFKENKLSCAWFKNLSELALFFVYKWTSNFGMSWVRPFIGLCFSAFIMWFYIKVPTENHFGFFNEFSVFRFESISFKDAILKTALPLSTAREFKNSLLVNLHCLINLSLIFLLGLALRNKFKIK